MVSRTLTALVCLVVAACSGLYNYEAPGYTVRPGDTLYTIAWRNGVDHRDLAAWNNLSDPDRLIVGQRLVLIPTGTRAVSSPAPAAPSSSAASTSPQSAPQPRREPMRTAYPAPAWQWPIRGAVLSRFGESGSLATGVSIAGQLGQPVAAAADGEVVYAGGGLVAYGQVVIVKHNETYLSAYGYNRRLLVAEGDRVTRGQTIAEVGTGPDRRPRLHFEIRRNGDPIDPLALLGAGS
ncbi:MAG: peptidoglycan DD-metalloendopeptidase family protein [Gammaproteobacteria bacterium]|nr:peptidoglycan DD-metalloendopeptidase family protein [Gammaproteobacteria bacterium]